MSRTIESLYHKGCGGKMVFIRNEIFRGRFFPIKPVDMDMYLCSAFGEKLPSNSYDMTVDKLKET